MVNCEPGAVERVLKLVKTRMARFQEQGGSGRLSRSGSAQGSQPASPAALQVRGKCRRWTIRYRELYPLSMDIDKEQQTASPWAVCILSNALHDDWPPTAAVRFATGSCYDVGAFTVTNVPPDLVTTTNTGSRISGRLWEHGSCCHRCSGRVEACTGSRNQGEQRRREWHCLTDHTASHSLLRLDEPSMLTGTCRVLGQTQLL